MITRLNIALISLLVALYIPSISATELYRWVDDQGVVHYSDQKSSDKATDYTPETKLSTYSNTHFLQQPKPDYSDLPPVNQRRQTPDLERLHAVQYPQSPNAGNVTRYIQQIYDISRYQKIHLTSDPQVSMLMQVGPEYLHLLIRETYSHVGWHNYGIEVITQLATDRHKLQIVDSLKRYSKYARVIYAKGWHHELQGRLIDGLRKNRGFVPTAWIKAVAEFDREDAKAVLIEYFKFGWNNHITYQQIVGIKSIEEELQKAVPVAWETASENNQYARRDLTPRALEVGYKPALKFVMGELASADRPDPAFNARALAHRFTEQTGSAQEILSWYRINQRSIRFDSDRSIFVAN
jgi:hypothetical protein